MTLTVSPTLDEVCLKVGGAMVDPTYGVVPAGTPVIQGPINRGSQPAQDHVIITPIHRARLRTNVETDVDPYPLPGGRTEMEQGVKVHLQVDFYGGQASNWCEAFTTWWRSEYGVRDLAPVCAPLYADEGRMIPLVTGEEQYLDRWTVSAMLQYNPVTSTPQQFADTLAIEVINVDERYPP